MAHEVLAAAHRRGETPPMRKWHWAACAPVFHTHYAIGFKSHSKPAALGRAAYCPARCS